MDRENNDKKQIDKLQETAKKIDKPEIKKAIQEKIEHIKSDKPVKK